MGSTFLAPPAKRPIHYLTPTATTAVSSAGMCDPNSASSNKRSKVPPPPLPVPPGYVSFRLLCHSSRVGGVIGKSGNIIKQVQQQTSSKIRIEDAPTDSSDRVITIIAPNAVESLLSLTSNNNSNCTVDVRCNASEEVDVSKAQVALVRVFERILEVAAESDGIGVAVAGGMVSCRLLAEASQVGSVIGKRGKVVEKIKKDCGCKIRILMDRLPVCAGSTEEMVEIEGDVLAVKKALVAVSRCLQDVQPVDKTRLTANKPIEAVPQESLPEVPVELHPPHNSVLPTLPSSSVLYGLRVNPLPLESNRVPTLDRKTLKQEVVFRILCSNNTVGGVIGKGGNIVKALHNETGASISIGATIAECDERLITVTASENPAPRYSASQTATVLVFSRTVEAGIEKGLDSGSSKRPLVTARLVVSSNQVGCLLGKGGTIISEMRNVTRTGIRIMGGDQVPKCVPENDSVVQISGVLLNVKHAIYQVTGRLRDNLFSSIPSAYGTRITSSALIETSHYARLKDPFRDTLREPVRDAFREPVRDTLRDPVRDTLRDLVRDPLRDALTDPLRDALMDPLRDNVPRTLQSSAGVSHSLGRHTSLTESMDHLGLSHSLDQPPSPRSWVSQTISGVNPRAITDVSRGLTSFKGGFELGSGGKAAFVTNTTVEIVIPESAFGAVYGENGGNLARLRQISGAKVIVHEPRLRTSDRIIVISGTPDETQAAQSLLQAFILTGQP